MNGKKNDTLFELSKQSTLPTSKRRPTVRQFQILEFIKLSGGECTKAQIVDKVGKRYYCNAENHVGATLGRMIKAGMIKRVKNGVYTIPESVVP